MQSRGTLGGSVYEQVRDQRGDYLATVQDMEAENAALRAALEKCVEWLDAIRVDSEAARVMLDACPSGFYLNIARAALSGTVRK